MGLLYDRKYSVEIISDFDNIIFDDIQMVFDISKMLTKTPDSGSIQLYNLTAGNDILFNWNQKKAKVVLKCGYRDLTPDIIFSGEVVKYERVYDETDVISVLTLGDGYEALTKVNLNKSYKSGMNAATIIEDVIKSVKAAGVEITGDIKKKIAEIKAENKKVDSGLSISGLLSSTLETLLKPFNKTITIQDDVLKIVEIGKEEVTGKYTILTPETGLIGSPSKTKDGLEFVALIQPGKFNPGQFVEIKSRDFDGRYKIVKSNFVGDTHGNDWYVRGLCI